tara:strand:- start:311 stop:940 length:630 start_codon:yes stop_codon:yes gene_type:complete
MIQKHRILVCKMLIWVAALSPGAWLVAGLIFNWLGPNPIERLTHITGMTTLVLLLVTLSITPLRRITGWNGAIRLRRLLGLFSFFYALTHFNIWFVFDQVFNWRWMIEDIIERPYITVGFSAFVTLIPLALTSTKGWMRRLGIRWTKIHRGIYLAATLGVIHYYWLVKSDVRLPLLLAFCLSVLLIYRVPGWLEKRRRTIARSHASDVS